MSAFCRIVLASLAIFATPPLEALAQKDVAGSADHALVGRYEGSVATFYQAKAYDEVKLPFKPAGRNDKDKAAWQSDPQGLPPKFQSRAKSHHRGSLPWR